MLLARRSFVKVTSGDLFSFQDPEVFYDHISSQFVRYIFFTLLEDEVASLHQVDVMASSSSTTEALMFITSVANSGCPTLEDIGRDSGTGARLTFSNSGAITLSKASRPRLASGTWLVALVQLDGAATVSFLTKVELFEHV